MLLISWIQVIQGKGKEGIWNALLLECLNTGHETLKIIRLPGRLRHAEERKRWHCESPSLQGMTKSLPCLVSAFLTCPPATPPQGYLSLSSLEKLIVHPPSSSFYLICSVTLYVVWVLPGDCGPVPALSMMVYVVLSGGLLSTPFSFRIPCLSFECSVINYSLRTHLCLSLTSMAEKWLSQSTHSNCWRQL